MPNWPKVLETVKTSDIHCQKYGYFVKRLMYFDIKPTCSEYFRLSYV